MKHNNALDMFYGFWKYLGVMSVFLIGISLFWWGIMLVQNDLSLALFRVGTIGYLLLMPLIVGLVLSWMGVTEFLSIIRE